MKILHLFFPGLHVELPISDETDQWWDAKIHDISGHRWSEASQPCIIVPQVGAAEFTFKLEMLIAWYISECSYYARPTDATS